MFIEEGNAGGCPQWPLSEKFIMAMNTDLAWQFVLDGEQFSSNNISHSLRMQHATYEQTKHLGEAVPLAVEMGERNMKPLIFTTAGELLEQLAGRLISQRA